MANRAAIILGFLAVSVCTPASAQSVKTAAVRAFMEVCVPASETSGAPRDLAIAAGYTSTDSIDPGLRAMFPLAGLSFVAPSDEGRVQVVSTVMPPPSTPSSCLVTVNGNAEGIFAEVTAPLVAKGYVPNATAQRPGVETLDMQKASSTGIDRVLGMRNLNPQGDGDMLLIAYRVE